MGIIVELNRSQEMESMQKLNIENIFYDQGPNPQSKNKDCLLTRFQC